jgi:hypothetical protein
MGKLRHATIGILKGKSLMGRINRFMATNPNKVFFDRCPKMRVALQDWIDHIRAASKKPTHIKALVPGEPGYKGTLDTAGVCGAKGIWVPGTKELVPIMWRIK